MTRRYTKKQRAEIRRLQDLAWERELGSELSLLEDILRSWRDGKIDVFDVSDEIHQFHDKRSRSLYSFYSGSNPFAVPSAIAKGIIKESEASGDLLEVLRDSIEDLKTQSRGSETPTPNKMMQLTIDNATRLAMPALSSLSIAGATGITDG